jgi:hypothetical protein
MIVGREIFRRREVGELVCQLVRLVDQSRQTLRADIKLLTLEF